MDKRSFTRSLQEFRPGLDIVLANLLGYADRQLLGQADYPAPADKALRFFAFVPATDVSADLRRHGGIRGLASRADQLGLKRSVRDVAIVHARAGLQPTQHVLRGIEERHLAV